MKNNLQSNPAILKIIVLFTCFMLVMLYNKSKACSFYPPCTYKKVSVSFKQDIAKNELKVFLKAASIKSVSLYFFSSGGKLLKEILVSAQKETTVTDMKKGSYSYECFDNGLKVNAGELELK